MKISILTPGAKPWLRYRLYPLALVIALAAYTSLTSLQTANAAKDQRLISLTEDLTNFTELKKQLSTLPTSATEAQKQQIKTALISGEYDQARILLAEAEVIPMPVVTPITELATVVTPEPEATPEPITKPKATTTPKAVTTPKPTATPTPESVVFPANGISIAGIVALTNSERSKVGLPALQNNSLLNKAGTERVKDMISKQYFAHTSPAGVGYVSFVNAVGYNWTNVGENIASGTAGHASDQTVVTMWMNSPGHKANILKPEFTEIGIGIAEGVYKGERQWFAVQLFGTP